MPLGDRRFFQTVISQDLCQDLFFPISSCICLYCILYCIGVTKEIAGTVVSLCNLSRLTCTVCYWLWKDFYKAKCTKLEFHIGYRKRHFRVTMSNYLSESDFSSERPCGVVKIFCINSFMTEVPMT